ncbi:MAG: hypothetical protein AB8C84_09180 [Oligoflexales bacterium]
MVDTQAPESRWQEMKSKFTVFL